MTELYEKLNRFNDYLFIDETHEYFYCGEKVNKSVTQLIHDLQPPFDEAKWLPKKAAERGITPEELKIEWIRKSNISTCTGTAVHSYLENALANKRLNLDFSAAKEKGVYTEVIERFEKIIQLADKFISDSKNRLIPIKSEIVVGLGAAVAGQIDQLFYNKKSGELQIWDWKTNGDIKFGNDFQKYNEPFSDLEVCEINTYSLQLNAYKVMLARHGIITGDCFITWFNENNDDYRVFKCHDYYRRVNELFKNF